MFEVLRVLGGLIVQLSRLWFSPSGPEVESRPVLLISAWLVEFKFNQSGAEAKTVLANATSGGGLKRSSTKDNK